MTNYFWIMWILDCLKKSLVFPFLANASDGEEPIGTIKKVPRLQRGVSLFHSINPRNRVCFYIYQSQQVSR
jgi:hypothetical protein